MKNGKNWSENDKKKLIELYQLGYTFPEIAVKMDRSCFAVQAKMQLLRLQGRAGYRTSESEAAANERGLFKPQPVEFENNVVMIDKATRTNTIFNDILENIRYTHDKKNDYYKDSYSD